MSASNAVAFGISAFILDCSPFQKNPDRVRTFSIKQEQYRRVAKIAGRGLTP